MLDALFKPRAIAVIGASNKELSIGNVVVKNLQTFGYKGPIYPVNPTATEICGLKAYRSISDVPGEVDSAQVCIPNKFVPQAVEECGKRGVKAVIINTSGFSEIGEEGAVLQQEILSFAKQYGVRVMGPNCQGIINTDPSLRAYCNFTFTYPKPGHISVVALSGGVGGLIMQALHDLGIGMRMYASNGNACDVSIAEIIRYWGDDDDCRAIIAYTEGFSDPKEFLQAAQAVARKKPVLAMKAGRTEQGAKAASSHTGSLAGVDKTTELIFEKTGILSFSDEAEMVRAAMAFSAQPIPTGNRVGIITNTGGPAVIATDSLVASGLTLAKISGDSLAKLRETQLPEAALHNPFDLMATAGVPQFRAALEILLAEEAVDCIFINCVTPLFADVPGIGQVIADVSKLGKKPLVCNFMTDLSVERFRKTLEVLQEGGVPCYPNPSEAARAMGALFNYGKVKQRDVGQVEIFRDADVAKAKSVINAAQKRGQSILSAAGVYTILEAFGIPVAPWEVVDSADDAVAAASNIGYPVVVKADSDAISHKSDMGGVVVNLIDSASVCTTVNSMGQRLRRFGDLRYLVQKFLPGGRELIIGATEARGIGHMLMFGLGGIYVEVLKDVVFKLAPLSRVEAEEMLSLLKAAALLEWVRGQKGVDRRKVIDVIQRVSFLLSELPMIAEMDLNPVVAFEDCVFAVDGRIRLQD
jgi:acyl-CoA synthetase (NDP forming)